MFFHRNLINLYFCRNLFCVRTTKKDLFTAILPDRLLQRRKSDSFEHCRSKHFPSSLYLVPCFLFLIKDSHFLPPIKIRQPKSHQQYNTTNDECIQSSIGRIVVFHKCYNLWSNNTTYTPCCECSSIQSRH